MKIICLTPVKNEAWILERFLESASKWADHIIIADQNSEDGSRDIALKFPKVKLIENKSHTFNEPERQKMLLDEARKISGKKLLIALDADEMFTENFRETLDWKLITSSQPGTIITFEWAQVMPDQKNYYIYPAQFELGFIDDGAVHKGKDIHSPRLPKPKHNPQILVKGFKVLHLCLIDIERFKSKIRWYQCWEYLEGRWVGKGALVKLYRWYHQDFVIPNKDKKELDDKWFENNAAKNELLKVEAKPYYRWDKEILKLFELHGTQKFSKLALWDVDWNKKYKTIYQKPSSIDLSDPRSTLEKRIHKYLEKTQLYYSRFPRGQQISQRIKDRAVVKIARETGW